MKNVVVVVAQQEKIYNC